MKTLIVGLSMGLVGYGLIAADATEEVRSAAKKLADKANYSWTSSSESQGGGQGRGEGSREGKTEKNGHSLLNMTFGENTVQAAFKGDKGVIKTEDGWQSLQAVAESEGEELRRLRFTARRLQAFKAPHAEAEGFLKHVKELKKDDTGAYSGQLSAEGLKEVYGRGFRRSGDTEGPDVSGLKGRVKFWLKDGVLSKYSNHIEGSMKFGDRDVDVDRTTTVEIKEVGSTKVNVPEEAKKKLSS